MKYIIKQAKCLKLDLERIGRKVAIRMNKDLIIKVDIEAILMPCFHNLRASSRSSKYATPRKDFQRRRQRELKPVWKCLCLNVHLPK